MSGGLLAAMDKARGPWSLQSPAPDAGWLTGRFSSPKAPVRCVGRACGAWAGRVVQSSCSTRKGMVCQAGGVCPNSQRPGRFPVSWPQPQPGAVFVADLPLLEWQQPLPRWPSRSDSVKRALCTRACVEADHVAWGSSLTKPALVRTVPSPVAVPRHPSWCSLASGAARSPGWVGGRAVVPRLPGLGPPPAQGLATSD